MPKLFCKFSSMNAGKSLQLLSARHNYLEKGMEVALFTAAIDDRYGAGVITSRVGPSAAARVFDANTVFSLEMVGNVNAVLIDEAQFLTPAQVRQLHMLANRKDGIAVLCFGLRTDFQGLPFPGSAMLLALAEDIEEVRAMCKCGRKASMNIRLDGDGKRVKQGAQIEVGGNERYESACARCFYEDFEESEGSPASA